MKEGVMGWERILSLVIGVSHGKKVGKYGLYEVVCWMCNVCSNEDKALIEKVKLLVVCMVWESMKFFEKMIKYRVNIWKKGLVIVVWESDGCDGCDGCDGLESWSSKCLKKKMIWIVKRKGLKEYYLENSMLERMES